METGKIYHSYLKEGSRDYSLWRKTKDTEEQGFFMTGPGTWTGTEKQVEGVGSAPSDISKCLGWS